MFCLYINEFISELFEPKTFVELIIAFVAAFFGFWLALQADKKKSRDNDERKIIALLKNCIATTNSNIVFLRNDGLGRNGSNSSLIVLKGLTSKLISGLSYEPYSSFLNTGLQFDLDMNFQNTFLFSLAKLNDIKARLVELDSKIDRLSDVFLSSARAEWSMCEDEMRTTIEKLEELRTKIKKHLLDAGLKEGEIE